jgi:hypothetical protein
MNTPLVSGRVGDPVLLCDPYLIVFSPCVYTEKRKAEAERIRQKYPDRIPVRRSSIVSLNDAST